MHEFHFDDQYHTYHSSESCLAPEGQSVIHANPYKVAKEGVPFLG